jgi:hypothetical protein
MKTKKFPIALNLPSIVALLIILGRHIVQMMSQSSWFAAPNPAPTPPLATVTSHLDSLEAAEALAKGPAKGAAAARDVAQKVVEDDLSGLKAYVAMIIAMNIAQALAIMEAAGMTPKRFTPRHKALLALLMGAAPGQILMEAKAVGKSAAYEWQYSTDGAKTWTAMNMTNVAHTALLGATAGTTYSFRFRTTQKNVTTDWCQPVSIFVH